MKTQQCEKVNRSAWKVIDKHFEDTASLVKHQIDSFETFVSTGIDQVIASYSPIEVSAGPYDSNGPAIRYTIKPSDITVGRCVTHDKYGKATVLLPNDARLRNLTYQSQISVDFNIVANKRLEDGTLLVHTKRMRNVNIGSIPIMVGSRYCTLHDRMFRDMECPYDPTGYFIVNGNEKALVSLDRIGENKTYVFMGSKNSGSDSIVSEVRSVGVDNPGCPKTTSLSMNLKPSPYGNTIRATINSIRTDIPVALIFRALGVQTDREIVEWVIAISVPMGLKRKDVENDIQGSLADGCIAFTEKDALLHLLKYTSINQAASSKWQTTAQQANAVRNLLNDDLFPHAGDNEGKIRYLAYMIAKLLRVKHGVATMDDRDSYVNKRIDTPGALMTALFRQHYSKFVREIRSMLHKEVTNGAWRTTGALLNLLNINNVYKIIRPSIITSGMTYALATGNWGIKNSRSCKQGVAQVLNRMTFNATISHLRRINTRIEKTGKLVQPRKLHTTHWGIVCLSETPEGSSIGLVKNLALTASITVHSPAAPVISIIKPYVNFISSRKQSKGCLVTVNGAIIGTHESPGELVGMLKNLKHRGALSPFISIVWDVLGCEVRINTEAGRCCRPLLIVGDDGIPLILSVKESDIDSMSLAELVMGRNCTGKDTTPGVIEYLDVDEVDNSMIAMTPQDLIGSPSKKWTHLELNPTVALGVVAATIPFCHHNQSPRNTYQCAMAKQAIGVYSTKFRARHDTIAHILDYPQKPIVNTRMAKQLNVDALPSGINVVVAIATHTGFNQEDSVIFNEAAVQRGLFISTFYRTYKEHNSRNHSTGEEEHYYSPATSGNVPSTLKAFNYDKLDKTGFVPENHWVDSKDIIIGKCMPHKHNGVIVTRDCSIPVKNNEQGYIDANCYNDNRFPTTTSDGYSFCKVRLRSARVPTIGDKFSSRHGQKGTIGIVRAAVDMPVTPDGITPDIIINPHAIPSRMTVGQLMESVLGKRCCFTGEYGDATPFQDTDISEIGNILEQHGLHRHGNEIVMSGSTGEMLTGSLFMGVTYYQRLKHMTVDKCHSRSANGPVTALVRQPAEGRARDGGLRCGEMEQGTLLAHGAMHMLKERFVDCSDGFRVFVCNHCGNISTVNPAKDIYLCKPCNNRTAFSEIRIPYAFKLLTQECEAMGISMRYNCDTQKLEV
ncbi:DNA-directed RNA polymerase II subunit Rpb2 [Tetraselmis virus 1]|uniref:DNA-directed RNA polymerase subunit beta n=1 Tax=Tetraselmis virus 1 TaxID=2060617 RepID=A0A2P0VP65_9VIRU|nr:DNA-directed RNA polymerase II subunit Rpb2 [Tetraselmis virus 1]AUF82698.1 DNA-directed RNA polymerase II subunit Rpb2 [Tetraselmis virus 1]